MGISRRSALKALVAAAATATLRRRKAQAAAVVARPDAVGLLYDATRCVGCKACMAACNKANDLPADTALSGGLSQMLA